MEGDAVPERTEGVDQTNTVMEPLISDEEAIAKAIENQKKMNELLQKRRAEQQEKPLSFTDLEGDQPDGSYMICCQFWVKFTIFMLVLILAQMSKGGEPCGIDPISWVQGYFVILLLMAFAQLMCWFLLKCSCSAMCIVTWLGVSLVILLYLLVVWIIIGYSIYFSAENDCQSSPDNFGWLVVMVILLFFGFSVIVMGLVLLCIGCCVACALCFSSSSQEPQEGQNTVASQIIASPAIKAFYDPSLYPSTPNCQICLEDYQKGDKIIVLPCDDRHYFHDECLQKLVDANNGIGESGRMVPRCPICMTPIGEEQAGKQVDAEVVKGDDDNMGNMDMEKAMDV